jgi:hypothetical protein
LLKSLITPGYEGRKYMLATKTKAKSRARRRKKHCPVCKEEVSMTVIREAGGADDLWRLLCPTCESRFVLIRQQYQREKKPDIYDIDENAGRSAKKNCLRSNYRALDRSRSVHLVAKKVYMIVFDQNRKVLHSILCKIQQKLGIIDSLVYILARLFLVPILAQNAIMATSI